MVRSFAGYVGEDHVPEETDEVSKQHLIMDWHEEKVYVGRYGPDFPICQQSLLDFGTAGIPSSSPSSKISLSHDLVDDKEARK